MFPILHLLWIQKLPFFLHHTKVLTFCIISLSKFQEFLLKDRTTELVEDSKFVPLNADDPRYGPPVLLLMGFSVEDAEKIQLLLQELDSEFLKIVYCTENMIDQSLWEAVNTKQSNLDVSKIAKSLPLICVLSGLTGEEMMMFIDAFPETGLEPPAFAALVPNSANKPLSELIEEIMGDHEMLSARQSS